VRLKRRLLGEAGVIPALVLAGVALVVAFISVGGARAVVSADNTATRQALRQLPAVDSGVLVSADLAAWPGTGVLPAADFTGLESLLAKDLPRPQDFQQGRNWTGATMPPLPVTNPAPSAKANLPPVIEVSYRADLTARTALVTGSLPSGQARITPGRPGHPGRVTLTVAVSTATAARFSLRPGSVLDLFPAADGDPSIVAKVTGIVRPLVPESSFWQVDPAIYAPSLQSKSGPNSNYWFGGAFVGPGELRGLATAYEGTSEQISWFFPLRSNLTAAQVPRLESALAAFSTSATPRNDEALLNLSYLTSTTVSSGLAQGLSAFAAQWQGVAGTDSLLLVGLFAAGALLLMIASELAVEAYRPELTLVRVRGASLRQVAALTLTRSALITLPVIAVGILAAVAWLPAGGDLTGLVLGALTVGVAVGTVPFLALISAWRQRKVSDGRQDEMVAARPRLRRLVGELLVVAVAAGAVIDLRLRGAATPSTDTYLSASAVLVAAAVGLIVNRVYRGPLRGVAAIAASTKGPVGAVGLNRAARARAGSIGPALTLMLALTLVAFAVMVTSAVSSGQVAASWANVGADVQIAVPGLTGARLTGVTQAQLNALQRVPGVQRATAAYVALSTGTLAVNLGIRGKTSPPLGLAVVDPGAYGALSAQTPWTGFPSAALTRPRTGANGPVPVLVTPDVRAEVGDARLVLEDGGLNLPIKIIGTVTDTPAMPAGGSYLVLPEWAAARLPSIPPPTTVLLTGSAIDRRQLQATITKVFPPGCVTTIRSQVLSQLSRSPALQLSQALYQQGAFAAALLGLLAILFALASTARSRAAMLTRLAALGMTRAQATALSLTDALPLLAVAAIGSAVSAWLLSLLIGPVLGLDVFTGGAVPVTLEPTWPALVIPIAVAAALALAFLMLDGLASGQREIGAALRLQEAGQT
jgi:putative ABC transport system permease protein